MKRINQLLLILVLAINFSYAQNPFVTHIYTADPSARVFNDTLYVYTSHDKDDASYYNMEDWCVFSTADMKHWEAHDGFFSLNDVAWATKWAWAPDCIEKNDKYYFYYPVERNKIGVAVASHPLGPFKDELGQAIIDNSIQKEAGKEPIDPGMLIDNDGKTYMYFGCRKACVIEMADDLMSYKGKINELMIYDEEGNRQLWKKRKENEPNYVAYHGGEGAYGEGPWPFKKDGKYYLAYANGWCKDGAMVYAMADNPLGPFTFKGKLLDNVGCNTTHGSVVEFKGQWYIFYHNKALSNNNYRRSICVDKLSFNDDGTIQMVSPSKEGIGMIKMKY